MTKGYWIVHISITDPGRYPEYLAADRIVFEKYEARFLVRGGRFEAPEGPAKARHVVIEFDSFEKALACYHSPEYQAAAKLRRSFSDSEIVIVEGMA